MDEDEIDSLEDEGKDTAGKRIDEESDIEGVLTAQYPLV
jgi:hypothetical protein